jgi:hypothetical protein
MRRSMRTLTISTVGSWRSRNAIPDSAHTAAAECQHDGTKTRAADTPLQPGADSRAWWTVRGSPRPDPPLWTGSLGRRNPGDSGHYWSICGQFPAACLVVTGALSAGCGALLAWRPVRLVGSCAVVTSLNRPGFGGDLLTWKESLSSQPRLGRLGGRDGRGAAWRPCRSTRSSMFFDGVDRPRRTSQPQSRTRSRQSSQETQPITCTSVDHGASL